MDVGRLRGGQALPLGISRMTNVDRLRGGRQGAAAPPAPPAMGSAPSNPDLMDVYDECLTRMLTGRAEQAAAQYMFWDIRRHAPVAGSWR
jgi:hypothetical protein